MLLRRLVLLVVVLSGLAVSAYCGYLLVRDMASLRYHFAHFNQLVDAGADLRELSVADAREKTFRLNTFADGVGVLLGAILAAVGTHGLCAMPRAPRRADDGARPC